MKSMELDLVGGMKQIKQIWRGRCEDVQSCDGGVSDRGAHS
jgi:hypothetical protein